MSQQIDNRPSRQRLVRRYPIRHAVHPAPRKDRRLLRPEPLQDRRLFPFIQVVNPQLIHGLIGHRVLRQKLLPSRHRNHRRYPHRLHQIPSVHRSSSTSRLNLPRTTDHLPLALLYSSHAMNITRRRGTIALSITLGVLIVGGLITFNIAWIIVNERSFLLIVLGLILFGLLVTGVVLNTVFLVREVRRNERQDSFLNAVTHELKTPIASIRLYLETLQRREIPEAQRQDFYKIMLADSDRLLSTVETVLKAGELGARRRHSRTLLELAPLVADCLAITLQRHHLPAEAIQLAPIPGTVRLHVLTNSNSRR